MGDERWGGKTRPHPQRFSRQIFQRLFLQTFALSNRCRHPNCVVEQRRLPPALRSGARWALLQKDGTMTHELTIYIYEFLDTGGDREEFYRCRSRFPLRTIIRPTVPESGKTSFQ